MSPAFPLPRYALWNPAWSFQGCFSNPQAFLFFPPSLPGFYQGQRHCPKGVGRLIQSPWIPNRRLLHERLRHALATSKRNGSFGALLFLDLNKFKVLNDTHGHEAGDHLLIEVARRLKQVTREDDTVARLGGDEFVVLLEQIGQDVAMVNKHAVLVAEKIRQLLAEEYILGEIRHHGSASIGIATFSGDTIDPDQIIKNADAAMYELKQRR
ncbi:MAG: GGDEF domain-containing protein [Magnetococcales bacterium]|nr:GGDEF domain-containing protein [Magnetococcales bacterium]